MLVVALGITGGAYGFTWQQLGSDIEGEDANDRLGAVSLSDSGHTMAVGAHYDNSEGSVSVLQYNTTDNQWQKIGNDIQAIQQSSRFGQAVQLSGDGNTVAVGAVYHDYNTTISDSGAVMVYSYEESTGSWTQKGNTIEFPIQNLFLGEYHNELSISGDGSILAIGIIRDTISSTYDGRVHVYQFNSGNWELMGAEIPGPEDNDKFGAGVSLSHDGQTLAVGAPDRSASASYGGSLKIYEFSNGIWTQKGSELYGDNSGNFFGNDVSLSGDGNIVASGAYGYDEDSSTNSREGRVRVFNWTNGQWAPLGSPIVGEAHDDQSGTSIELSDNGLTIAIGDPLNNGTDPSHSNKGHVRFYRYTENNWVQVFGDIDGEGDGDYSGGNIGLSCNGEIVAVGATKNGNNAGHVRVFEVPDATGSDATCLAKFSTPTQNPTVSPPPNESSEDNSAQLGIIIGSVAGGIVVIGGLVYLGMNWSRLRGGKTNPTTNLGNLIF